LERKKLPLYKQVKIIEDKEKMKNPLYTAFILAQPMNYISKLLVFFFVLLTACVNTDMKGVIDPSYRNNLLIKKMIIKGIDMSLTEEAQLIDSFKKIARNYDIDVINGMDVFPKTREYTLNELLRISQKYSADSILWFFYEKKADSRYVPLGYSHSYASSYGNYTNMSTYFIPGFYSEQRKISVTFKMIDAKNGKTIWVADGNSSGDEDDFISYSDLIDDISERALSELAKKGLFKKKQ
jgi:hypothetical protein